MALCIFLCSCQTDADKAKTAVSSYITKTTIRPESYEPGTWQMAKGDNGSIHVRHKYRAFDGHGGMENNDAFFDVDASGKVTEISAADF